MSYSTPPSPGSTAAYVSRNRVPSQSGGLGRLSYFVVAIALGFGYLVAIGPAVTGVLGGLSISDLGGARTIAISLVWFALYLVTAGSRLQNTGSGAPMLLAMLGIVPIVNLYVGWRLVSCQEAYVSEGSLDGAGKMLTGLYIGLFAYAVFWFEV